MVLLKGYGKDGFKFFTHYTSRKGQELVSSGNIDSMFNNNNVLGSKSCSCLEFLLGALFPNGKKIIISIL